MITSLVVSLDYDLKRTDVTPGRLSLSLVFVELYLPHDLVDTPLTEVCEYDLLVVLDGLGIKQDLKGPLILVLLPLVLWPGSHGNLN